MSHQCSCGGRLPEDANFCPKCGRPLGGPAAVEPPELELPAGPESSGPPDAGSADAEAQIGGVESIRAALFPAGFAAVVSSIPPLNFLPFVWYPAAGFFAVQSFRKRLGVNPKTRRGAGLGAMTGIISFLISLVTVVFGVVWADRDELMEAFRTQAEEMGGGEAVTKILNDPVMFGMALVFGLALQCVIAVGFSALGGALASKLLAGRDGR